MEFKDLLYEIRNRAAWITLNRPRLLNALSAEMLTGIGRAYEAAAGDHNVRAVVMTGAGRGFCAGADIHVMDRASLESFRAFLLPFTELCTLIRNFPKPTIAAINGVAVGGGFELTLVCDFRIAARSATIGSHEVNINQPMTNSSTTEVRWWSSTTEFTSPILSASSAPMISPVIPSHFALPSPTRRGSR